MKNKINVTMGRQDVTDEELERLMDFDSLLQKHHQLQAGRKNYWKFIVPAITLVIVVGTLLFINQSEEGNVKQADKTDTVSLTQSLGEKDHSLAAADSTERQKTKVNTTPKKPIAKENSSTPPLGKNEYFVEMADTTLVPVVEEVKTVELMMPKESIYIQAEPVDGYEKLYEYFGRELIYPESAVKDSIQGVLTVSFLINKEGKPEQIKTSGSLGKAFEAEAIRLVESMPAWKSATLNGKPVSSRLSLPLTFQLRTKK